jgi:hypothetical protein
MLPSAALRCIGGTHTQSIEKKKKKKKKKKKRSEALKKKRYAELHSSSAEMYSVTPESENHFEYRKIQALAGTYAQRTIGN